MTEGHIFFTKYLNTEIQKIRPPIQRPKV